MVELVEDPASLLDVVAIEQDRFERARDPSLSDATVAQLKAFATAAPITGTATQMAQRRAQRFNALRQLVAASPDYQTC